MIRKSCLLSCFLLCLFVTASSAQDDQTKPSGFLVQKVKVFYADDIEQLGLIDNKAPMTPENFKPSYLETNQTKNEDVPLSWLVEPRPTPTRWAFQGTPSLTEEEKSSGKLWTERYIRIHDPLRKFIIPTIKLTSKSNEYNVYDSGKFYEGTIYGVTAQDVWILHKGEKGPRQHDKVKFVPEDQRYIYELEKRLSKKMGEWSKENEEFDKKVQQPGFEFEIQYNQMYKWMGKLPSGEVLTPGH